MRWGVVLIGALSLFGCGGEGGNATVSGGTCPTCSSGGTPSVTSACSNEQKSLASAPTKGGTPTTTSTTTTTTTGTGIPFAAPTTNVNVNTPPSSSVSINCVGGATTP
jgi:hypothetical protein